MQIARDSRPFGLLCRDQPARQVLDLGVAGAQAGFVLADRFLGALTLRDVNFRPDNAERGAIRPSHDGAFRDAPPQTTVPVGQTMLQFERVGPAVDAFLDPGQQLPVVDMQPGLPVVRAVRGICGVVTQQPID